MRYCKACGSLNWEGNTSCIVCSSNSLSEDGSNLDRIGLSSAFVLIYAVKPTAFHDFRVLSSVLQDIDPGVTEDALMMSAIQKTLPLTGSLEEGVLERGYIRQSLEEGRFSYPEEVIDELLEAYESIKVLATGGPHELADRYQQLQAKRANLASQGDNRGIVGIADLDTLAIAREMLRQSVIDDIVLKTFLQAYLSEPENAETKYYIAMKVIENLRGAQDLRFACALLIQAVDAGNEPARKLLWDIYIQASYNLRNALQNMQKLEILLPRIAAMNDVGAVKPAPLQQKSIGVKQASVADRVDSSHQKPTSQARAESRDDTASMTADECLYLGMRYLSGNGVSKNPSEGVRLLGIASQKGNIESLYQLGVLYESGNGVEVNLAKAAQFYKSAAQKGFKQASSKMRQFKFWRFR